MMDVDLDAIADDAATVVPSDEVLTAVAALVERQAQLEAEVADREAALKKRKEELRRLAEHDLPDAMLAAGGLTRLDLASGLKVKVTPFYDARIPQDRADEAFAWLRRNGHGDLIKHEVALSFSAGQEQEAEKALCLLLAEGFAPKDDERVHPQTLKAFIREQLEAGSDLPLDLFGVYAGQRAKITREGT